MTIVTISSAYRIVIPKDVREALRLKPGQKVTVFADGHRIKIIPVLSMEEAWGFLKGIDTTIDREIGHQPRL